MGVLSKRNPAVRPLLGSFPWWRKVHIHVCKINKTQPLNIFYILESNHHYLVQESWWRLCAFLCDAELYSEQDFFGWVFSLPYDRNWNGIYINYRERCALVEVAQNDYLFVWNFFFGRLTFHTRARDFINEKKKMINLFAPPHKYDDDDGGGDGKNNALTTQMWRWRRRRWHGGVVDDGRNCSILVARVFDDDGCSNNDNNGGGADNK